MKCPYRVPLFAGLLAWLAVSAAGADDRKVFEIDGLKSAVPASWKAEKPRNRLRFAEFRVPRAEGDSADADLSVFRGISGTTEENLTRWKGQFLPPKGKSIDDVSKVTKFKVAGREVVYFEVEGIFLDGPPMLPASKKKKRPDYRMIAVQLDGPKNVWHFKLIGPAKTVEKHKKEFDNWLKSFK